MNTPTDMDLIQIQLTTIMHKLGITPLDITTATIAYALAKQEGEGSLDDVLKRIKEDEGYNA